MAVIRTFFGLVLIFVFVVFGYWMYATYNTRTGDDPIWAGINGMMPEVLRQWACTEVGLRIGQRAPAPQNCGKYWRLPGPEEAAAPGAEDMPDAERSAQDSGEPASATAVE